MDFFRSTKTLYLRPDVVTKYQKRISGPWLDRIDVPIEVARVGYEELSGDRLRESSEIIRAGGIQLKRFSKNRSLDIVCNTDMRIREIRQFCELREEGQGLMRAAMSQPIC